MKIMTKTNKGDLCIELTFKISSHDTSIVDLKNNINLPFCLQDAHLPMAETRLIEAIDSTVYPVRVEVVEFIKCIKRVPDGVNYNFYNHPLIQNSGRLMPVLIPMVILSFSPVIEKGDMVVEIFG